jgi:hypothetical protein
VSSRFVRLCYKKVPFVRWGQEGGGPGLPCGSPFNASPLGDPNCAGKQRTQEGGPSMPGPIGGNFNADPTYNPYKQHTQNLTHVDLGEAAGKAK